MTTEAETLRREDYYLWPKYAVWTKDPWTIYRFTGRAKATYAKADKDGTYGGVLTHLWEKWIEEEDVRVCTADELKAHAKEHGIEIPSSWGLAGEWDTPRFATWTGCPKAIYRSRDGASGEFLLNGRVGALVGSWSGTAHAAGRGWHECTEAQARLKCEELGDPWPPGWEPEKPAEDPAPAWPPAPPGPWSETHEIIAYRDPKPHEPFISQLFRPGTVLSPTLPCKEPRHILRLKTPPPPAGEAEPQNILPEENTMDDELTAAQKATADLIAANLDRQLAVGKYVLGAYGFVKGTLAWAWRLRWPLAIGLLYWRIPEARPVMQLAKDVALRIVGL